MKNTNEIKTILTQVANKKLSTDEALAQIQAMINSYSDTRAHPGIYDDKNNLVAKWCSKHKQYELATTFPRNSRSKDGLYSHCRYAEKRAKQYSAKITKLKDNFFKGKLSEDQVKKEISKLEASKNNYNFEQDAPKDVINEQVNFEKKFKDKLSELV